MPFLPEANAALEDRRSPAERTLQNRCIVNKGSRTSSTFRFRKALSPCNWSAISNSPASPDQPFAASMPELIDRPMSKPSQKTSSRAKAPEAAPIDPLALPVTRDDVILGYRMIFGRDPESEVAINYHIGQHADVGAMRDMLIAHSQFRTTASGPRVDRGKWVMTEIFGAMRMWVDLHDIGVSRGCILGDWEQAETRYMREKIGLGDTVIDIGANIGWFSLLAAARCGDSGHVHAFEPHPVIARYLNRSIHDSRVDNRVTLHQLALDEKRGEAVLGARANTNNPGHNWLLGAHEKSDAQFDRHKVATARLDDLLPDATPAIIKIDVEGAEARVMRGARDLLRRAKPLVLSELFPEQLKAVSGVTASDFIGEMAQLGYQCWELGHAGPTRKLKDFPDNASASYVSVVFEPA
jgi:FkbM family methyltransferase